MPRRSDPAKPGYARREIIDRPAYNRYMREYRARKARERVAKAVAVQHTDTHEPGEEK